MSLVLYLPNVFIALSVAWGTALISFLLLFKLTKSCVYCFMWHPYGDSLSRDNFGLGKTKLLGITLKNKPASIMVFMML